MGALRRLSRLIDALNGAMGRVVALLVGLMVLLAAGNALLRHLGRLLGSSLTSNAALEGQWYLFSAVFLLGAAAALKDDRHVRVDLLRGRLSPRGRAAVDLAGTLLLLLPFCAFAHWVTWPSVAASFALGELSPDPGGLPRYPVKALPLLSLHLLILQGVSEAIKNLDRLLAAEPP